MSTDLFAIAATAFLVVLAAVFVVFAVKYVRGRVGGRGPLGLRHTFAQYEDDEYEGGAGPKSGADDGREFR